MSESNPYIGLPSSAFWKSAVAEGNPLHPHGIYRKKFRIEKNDRIATAGSCFAQHIAKNLTKNKFKVLDFEEAPPGLARENHSKYGFSMYSARYGNIYTTRQLLQLVKECFQDWKPTECVWEKNGRFFDAFRPAVEPYGLSSPDEVRIQRNHHLKQVKKLFLEMDILIFTLGLTETWEHISSGTVYPTAPGTIAGKFDKEKYIFKNFNFNEINDDLDLAFDIIRRMRQRDFKVILTVSPVPLTATASGLHVLPATTYSKSVLRAVAGHQSQTNTNIDYFPSFEIINSIWNRGIYYENNLRSVTSEGVKAVMDVFFTEHMEPNGNTNLPNRNNGILAINIEDSYLSSSNPNPTVQLDNTKNTLEGNDVQCEEALLERFSR